MTIFSFDRTTDVRKICVLHLNQIGDLVFSFAPSQSLEGVLSDGRDPFGGEATTLEDCCRTPLEHPQGRAKKTGDSE